MARRPRSTSGPGYFHVINRTVGKVPIFERSADYRAFLGVLAEGLKGNPVPLLSYCVMSNHFHLVTGPTDPATLSRLMHWVTTTHAVRYRRRRRTTGFGPVYQGRFHAHLIVELAHLVTVCRYVERNPVRAGLVRLAQNWPWSSLAARVAGSNDRVPVSSTPFLESQAWTDYVNAPLTPQERMERPVPEPVDSVENRYVPLDNGAQDPSVGAERGSQPGGMVRRRDHDQPHAHVERPEHLRLIDTAGPLKPREDRRHLPALSIE